MLIAPSKRSPIGLGLRALSLNKTLRLARESIERANTLLTTDAGIGYHLEESLNSLTEAAEALRLLATTLEQNPACLSEEKTKPTNKMQRFFQKSSLTIALVIFLLAQGCVNLKPRENDMRFYVLRASLSGEPIVP